MKAKFAICAWLVCPSIQHYCSRNWPTKGMAVDVSVTMSISLFAFSDISRGLDFTMIMKRTYKNRVGPFCDKVQFDDKWQKP